MEELLYLLIIITKFLRSEQIELGISFMLLVPMVLMLSHMMEDLDLFKMVLIFKVTKMVLNGVLQKERYLEH